MSAKRKRIRFRDDLIKFLLNRLLGQLEAHPSVMTPKHKRWPEFLERLEGPEGCNFRRTDPDDAEFTAWTCDHSHDLSKKILARMQCDQAMSIVYFQTNGGYCDCEVLFNVGPRHGAPPRQRKQRRRSRLVAKGVGRSKPKVRS